MCDVNSEESVTEISSYFSGFNFRKVHSMIKEATTVQFYPIVLQLYYDESLLRVVPVSNNTNAELLT